VGLPGSGGGERHCRIQRAGGFQVCGDASSAIATARAIAAGDERPRPERHQLPRTRLRSAAEESVHQPGVALLLGNRVAAQQPEGELDAILRQWTKVRGV